MHGTVDSTVIPLQSILLHDSLKAKGIPSTLLLLEDHGHGGKKWAEQESVVAEFFMEKLHASRKNLKYWDKRFVYSYYYIPENVRYEKFIPGSAGREYGYMLYLPPSYDKDRDMRYPVVYFLPGRGGDANEAWPTMTAADRAIREGSCPEMIIVGVNGVRSSWYSDDVSREFPMETLITRDLIDHIDNTYQTLADRENRMIEGFSMGGHGAAKLGFKYPEKYGHVSIMAGAFIDPAGMTRRHNSSIEQVFGGDIELYKKNAPGYIVRENAGSVRGNSHVRICVGGDDGLKQRNVQFHELLDQLSIEHEFEVVDSTGHNMAALIQNFQGDYFAFYHKAFIK